MTHPCPGIAISLFAAAVLAGCGTSPEPRFYTLDVDDNPGQNRTGKAMADSSVTVGPVTLPDMVDRPEFVIRVGTNQVVLTEQHRWAEPLKSEIPRVIAENLTRLLDTTQVSVYPQSAGDHAQYRVLVDVHRFESILGRRVLIDALWTIRHSSKGEPVSKTGRSTVDEPANGSGYDALAAAHGRGLARISHDIADAIRSTPP
jgi:uncharacterized lipoprotein YmbA